MKIADKNSEKRPFRIPFFGAMKKRGLVNDEPAETKLVQDLAKKEAENVGSQHVLEPK